jgi:poly(3-hydroxybutyrate) depolymerase
MTYWATLAGLASLAGTTSAAVALGAYNIDPSSVSVSGLSSGGFFSAQLGVAYSNVFQTGFGVFAGGPYDCARNQAVNPPFFRPQYLFAGLIDMFNHSTLLACTIKIHL